MSDFWHSPLKVVLKFIFSNIRDDIFSHIVYLGRNLICGIYDRDILVSDGVDLRDWLIYHIYAVALFFDALAHLVDALS